MKVLNRVWSIERPYNAAVLSGAELGSTTKPSAAGLGSPNNSMIRPTRARNGRNIINAQITPKRLKIVCDIAARLAWVLPTEAAIFAVMVVPIFSPNTIAHAILNGIQPILSIIRVIAIVADDDWSTRVRIVPNTKKISTEPKPWLAQLFTNSSTSGVSLRFGTDSFINERPRKSNEKPTTSSPIFCRWFFLEFEQRKPTAISGMARIEISALKPSHATNHAVTVVPILAPIITPIACARVRSPAFTKLTTITVVADDDWISDVIPKPVITPLNGLEVIAVRKPRSLSPAAF